MARWEDLNDNRTRVLGPHQRTAMLSGRMALFRERHRQNLEVHSPRIASPSVEGESTRIR